MPRDVIVDSIVFCFLDFSYFQSHLRALSMRILFEKIN